MVDKLKLERILEDCWNNETTASKAWTPENKSLGQCAVTACVVQDYLGGEIVWAEATLPDGKKDSHYFNKIDGAEVDLTRQQFPQGTIVPEGAPKTKNFSTTRDYVLSFESTLKRYELLKSRVDNVLKEE